MTFLIGSHFKPIYEQMIFVVGYCYKALLVNMDIDREHRSLEPLLLQLDIHTPAHGTPDPFT